MKITIEHDSRTEVQPTVVFVDTKPADPPVVVPPTVQGDVWLIPSQFAHRQYGVGPVDKAKRADLEAAVAATPAWTWFANAQQEFSPSVSGRAVSPSEWVRLPVWGNFTGLYKGCPMLTADGAVSLNSKAPGDDIALNVVPFLKTYPLRPGKRGQAVTTPYTAWRYHSRKMPDGSLSMNPDVPYLVGVDVLGNIWYRMRDGSVRQPFTIPGAKEVHDWCPRPASRKTMYVANTGGNEVLEILRGTTDFSIVGHIFIGRPTSVVSTPDDALYIVSVGAVWKRDQSGLRTKLADIPNAFYLDYDSRGHLVVATLNLQVWDVDPATGAATVLYVGGSSLQSWVTVSVDREGTCGERDNIMLCHMHSGGNDTITVRKAGVWIDAKKGVFPLGIGQTTIGSANYSVDIVGHYPWTAIYSQDSAEIYTEGVSDGQGSVLAVRTSAMAPQDVYDHAAFTAGRWIIDYGCGPGTPVGTVPSFTCQMADQGWSGIGETADSICEMTFAQQAAYIRGGMAGSYPRKIVGRDLYNVLYFLGRSSQRGFREGKPYFDALKAYCTPMFGQELPPLPENLPGPNGYWPAALPNSFVDIFMRATVTNGAIKVTYSDVFGNPKTPEAGFVASVMVDETTTVADGATLAPGVHALRPISAKPTTKWHRGWSSVVTV